MNLVVVESASKAKTIQTYLNRSEKLKGEFKVMASLGHVMDLPFKTMGVHLTTWVPEYAVTETRKGLVEKLIGVAKGAKQIYLAADPDREGEAIADHLATLFVRAGIPRHTMVRVAFNEITEEALVEAVLNPRAMDRDLIEAQETRRILDRVVGYESSPLLWRRFATTKLSAGRVQSAALKMIVERYLAFTKHTFETYWTLEGDFHLSIGSGMTVKAHAVTPERWVDADGVRDEIKRLTKKFQWTIQIQKKMGTRRPPAPLTTSAMQQEAATKHGFPIDRTMRMAQELYEMGAITYMRTDSTVLSKTAQGMVQRWITDAYGKEMVQSRVYKTKVANAQEAHEAIRPTNVEKRASDYELAPSHRKLYDLIWRRTVASQMKEATVMTIEYRITGERRSTPAVSYVFQGSDDVLVELGFLSVLQPDTKIEPSKIQGLETLALYGGVVEPKSFEFKGNITRPDPLFQEPSLVKQLEKKGIGRPSTFAPILKKLSLKGYVYKGAAPPHVDTVTHYRLVGVGVGDGGGGGWEKSQEEESITVGGKETTSLVPSSLGIRVVEYLDETLEKVVNAEFTAQMEKQLDEISRGELSKKQMLDGFYKPFHRDIERAQAIQKEYAAAAKKKPQSGVAAAPTTELAPSNVLKPFESLGANVVQTRFGPALYILKSKTFVSVTPLLQWRKKTLDELTQSDVRFLMKLPLTVDGTAMQIVMGRYGLYIKNNGESMKLERVCWDAIYKNEWTPELIQKHAIALAPKGSLRKGRAKLT